VLRAAGETETKQENSQDWLELGEGGSTFQLPTDDEFAAVIFIFIYFPQRYLYY
jgi:uncharacterized protein YaiE (UPF0345 family)